MVGWNDSVVVIVCSTSALEPTTLAICALTRPISASMSRALPTKFSVWIITTGARQSAGLHVGRKAVVGSVLMICAILLAGSALDTSALAATASSVRGAIASASVLNLRAVDERNTVECSFA